MNIVKLSSPFLESNRISHLLVRTGLEASPFELIMMVSFQSCCGDDKTTNRISMTTRPNSTYDILISLSIRPEHVSVTIVPIEIVLELRQVYCEAVLKMSKFVHNGVHKNGCFSMSIARILTIQYS